MNAPSTRKIIYSYNSVFDEIFSSVLAYTSRPYSKPMAMCTSVTYTPCATSSWEQTGNIITFVQFEEDNLLSKNCNDAESSDKFDDDSIMPLLIIEEEMNAMDSDDESDDDSRSKEIFEDIH